MRILFYALVNMKVNAFLIAVIDSDTRIGCWLSASIVDQN